MRVGSILGTRGWQHTGMRVGSVLGMRVGSVLGMWVGSVLGMWVGSVLGMRVGSVLGMRVGSVHTLKSTFRIPDQHSKALMYTSQRFSSLKIFQLDATLTPV